MKKLELSAIKISLTFLLGVIIPVLFYNKSAQAVDVVNQSGTLVELCALAQQEVENNAVSVSISFKVEHRDKRVAADQVNQRMSSVIQAVKSAHPTIKVTNQNYTTYQQYTSKGQGKDWTVEQSFVLESRIPKEVPALVSLVQEAGMTVSHINSFLTPQATRAVQENLYKAAFDDVRTRLTAMSVAMNKPNTWQIMHVDGTGQRGCGGSIHGVSLMRSAKANISDGAAEVSLPTFETEKQMVQLSLWVAAKMK